MDSYSASANTSKSLRELLPSVTLRESQIHIMACEEGAAIQWKFNTGGVRNGLADQCQEAAGRG